MPRSMPAICSRRSRDDLAFADYLADEGAAAAATVPEGGGGEVEELLAAGLEGGAAVAASTSEGMNSWFITHR